MNNNYPILAKPITRGKSDIIENYPVVTGGVAVGKAVSLQDDGTVALFDATKPFHGVAGYVEINPTQQAVIRSGIDVPVITDGTAITVGATVYVTATGIFTGTATDNTQTGSKFKSVPLQGVNLKTGEIVDNVALIDFVGGL
ncbi:MAG: hypothetical protein LBR26_16795 [Prevotella sp.]|jgi:hypothetical protein|nr:hypothetical protein [Prevotella sp.]